jgi:hypothetical protein
MRILVVAGLLCSPQFAVAPSYPVSVPQECVPLALREHVGLTIENRYQALKAEYKLARLNKADPMVAQCRDAVDRLKAAIRS